ncbi:MAG: adenylate/guanylate cyclase domain-containing protein, partial [Chloroflexota bacterium]
MSRSTTNWLSFVPQFLAEGMAQQPELPLIQNDRRFKTVALFADVSGFTKMSEALAKTGRRGGEELTTLLNNYFSGMIKIVRRFGGHVGKFGGDAMTILFPISTGKTQPTIRRAIQCALDMQAAMTAYEKLPTSAGYFQLQMKAGLAMGTAYTTS